MVRLLEERLGYSLFRRRPNRLELTAQGQTFLSGLTEAFNSIARLAEQVAAMRVGPVLTVGVGPALAVNWLIPRLSGFYRSHPDIEVRMATGGATRPVRDDWTCTIRRDMGAWEGYAAEKLFPGTIVPVCIPALAKQLQKLDDFRGVTLLVVSHLRHQWLCWFKAVGIDIPERFSNEAVFESNAMAMQAVLDGVGVAIALLPYVSDALRAGRLVAPFPIAAQTGEAWLFEYRPIRQEDPALLAFRTWLLAEAALQREIEAKVLKQPVLNNASGARNERAGQTK